jgi:ketosteroid isomerase-like protein
MERRTVEQWVEAYERLWRAPGTEGLAALFAPDATYLPSPWARPVTGLEEIARFWDEERDSADEEFALSADVVAVDGDTAVVRVSVDYGHPTGGRWRDLWVVRLAEDGRCSSFEEWPFAPGQPDGH